MTVFVVEHCCTAGNAPVAVFGSLQAAMAAYPFMSWDDVNDDSAFGRSPTQDGDGIDDAWMISAFEVIQ